MMEKLNILEQREIMGKTFTIYGAAENPLFLAKEVAGWIEHTNPRVMLQTVEANEKVVNNVYTLGGQQECWFLTEDGLYEVLMQSRKPVAKQFKAKVKEILRAIRKSGTYSARPKQASLEPTFVPAIRMYREKRVLTIKDISQLIGKPEHSLIYYMRNKKSRCKEGTDYHLLKGDELRQFKEANHMPSLIGVLYVVLESGVGKLCKFFGVLPEIATGCSISKVPAISPIGEMKVPAPKTSWLKKGLTDVPDNPEIQKAIAKVRKTMTVLEELLNEFNAYNGVEYQEKIKGVVAAIGANISGDVFNLVKKKYNVIEKAV